MQALKKIQKKYLLYLIFLPLPIAFLLLAQWEMKIRGVFYEYNYDPAYIYLLNGLALLNGHAPFHVDHPGTTLQILTAIVIFFRHLLNGIHPATPLIDDVLLHPEEYLQTIRNVLLSGFIIFLYVDAIVIYNKTKSIWPAICFQLIPFLSQSLITSPLKAGVESLLIPLNLIGMMFLVAVTEKNQTYYPLWKPIVLGFFIGACVVTKFTSLPLVLLVFWFPRFRDRIASLAASIGTFFLLTIPVWSRANYFIHWIDGLITKQGKYGTGAEGVIPPLKTLALNLTNLVHSEPLYFVILGVFLVWLISGWRKRTPENRLERLRVSIFVGIYLVLLIMVLKFPNPAYLDAGLIWLCFCIVMIVIKFESFFTINTLRYKILLGIFMVIMVGSAFLNTYNFYNWFKSSSLMTMPMEAQKNDSFIKANYPDCIIVPFSGGSDIRFALQLGDFFTGDYFTKKLNKLYPKYFSYNIGNQYFTSFDGIENKDKDILYRLSRDQCILLRGGNLTDKDKAQMGIDELVDGRYENVYRLKSFHPISQ